MKYTFLHIFLFLFVSLTATASEVSVDVTLKPAGSFKAQTNRIKGQARKDGDKIIAENILVDLRSLKTGIELRDKHLKERLLVDKHPVAKLIKAEGTGGKGKATIQVKGMTQEVDGTYEVKGPNLVAKFKMLLSKLDITGVKYMGVGVSDEVVVNITVPLKEGTVAAAQ